MKRPLPEQYADWGHLEFFVPGKPQPQGSKTRNRWGGVREANPEVGPWRERTAIMAHNLMVGKPMLIDVPVVLAVQFVMYRPTTLPKKWDTPPAIKKPDEMKCVRAIEDAMTGIVYRDDSQIITHFVNKRMAEVGEEMGAYVWLTLDESWFDVPELTVSL